MLKAYFISDIHLKNPEESNSQKLLLFLHELAQSEDCTHLFLVGDIFDLWIYNHQYFVEKYKDIIEAIRALVKKGVEVHYFEGNHDLYLEKFWSEQVGVTVHSDPEYFSLGPWLVRIEHGDFMNPNDKGYLFLRSFLRSLPMKGLAKILPGPLVKKIGEEASQASRKYTSNEKSLPKEKVIDFMREYAEQSYRAKAFDIFVAGHTHVRDEHTFNMAGKMIKAVNLGSWYDRPCALVLDSKEVDFMEIE